MAKSKGHDPFEPNDQELNGKFLNKRLHSRFAYGVNSPEKKSFLFYDDATINVAATTNVLTYTTVKSPGGLTAFTFGFRNFTPLAGTYNLLFTFDSRPIPWTGGLATLEFSNFLNQRQEYFLDIPSKESRLILDVVNTGPRPIFPYIKIEGFYLGISNE